jgi:hypothetical protein
VEVVAGGRGEGDGLEQLAGPVALALQETKGADGQQMGLSVNGVYPQSNHLVGIVRISSMDLGILYFQTNRDGGKFRCKMMIHRLSLIIDYYVVVVFVKY